MEDSKEHLLYKLIRSKFEGKSVVLLGFGREGQATYQVFRRVFLQKQLTIADANDTVRTNPLVSSDRHVDFITGTGYIERTAGFDVIVRSPGVVIWPYVEGDVRHIKHHGQTGSSTLASDHHDSLVVRPFIRREQITSQTDLFLQAYGSQVIGVTGTKGKSTTSALIFHILKTGGFEVVLAGNIGNPVFHFAEVITPKTLVVFEMSSHQLEFLTRGPHVAVLLNLFQEHLDAYQSFESYQQAKLNIARYQRAEDYLIYNAGDTLVTGKVNALMPVSQACGFDATRELSPGCFIRNGCIWFASGYEEDKVWNIHQDRFLKGDHNLKNIMAAISVARLSGVSGEDIEDGISTFKGLEHRLEYLGEYGGIHFYDDSIATIPEACMEAVKAVPAVDTLIAGGFDRGIDYTPLAVFLAGSAVNNLILVGVAGKRIGKEMEKAGAHNKKLFYINRFNDFIAIANRETRPGCACLLSPAAASYDEFQNFEERGKRFRELAKGMKP